MIMRNIAEILKECPKGIKLYSPIFGDCTLVGVWKYNIETICCESGIHYCFYSDGTYFKSGECMLFPSEKQRDWDKFQKDFNVGLKKFKVGDRIKQLGSPRIYIIKEIRDDRYILHNGQYLKFIDTHIYVSVPKFDITTLKPFDKVLVRNNGGAKWMMDFLEIACTDGFICYKDNWNMCIPYEDNKHLHNTTNDCDDYYKTWE